jgi:hypothetical protein
MDPIITMQCGPIRHEIDDHTTFAKHLIVHPTGFTTAEPGTDGASIQAIYGELAADEPRNQLIANDIADAYRRGQCSLALTNRIEHLNQLATALKKHHIKALVLHGALPKTERDHVRSELSAPHPGPLAVLAIDKVAGEGLDAPRLDTLFLASPISFKGRVIQQVGRIMRDTQASNKNLVEVHDYLDEQVPLLERMHHKRRRILTRRGFTLVAPPGQGPQTNESASPPDRTAIPASSSPKPTAAQVRTWAKTKASACPPVDGYEQRSGKPTRQRTRNGRRAAPVQAAPLGVDCMGRRGWISRSSIVAVVVAGLEDLYFLVISPVHQTVFVIDPAGPIPRQVALQRLRLPDTAEGIALDLTDQPGEPLNHPAIRAEPKQEVLPSIGIEVDAPHTSPANSSNSSIVFVTDGPLSLSRAMASISRRALAGERNR